MRKLSSIILVVLMLVSSGVVVYAQSDLTTEEVQQLAYESPIHASLIVFKELEDPKDQGFVLLALAEKLAREKNYELIHYLAHELTYEGRNDFYSDVASWLVKFGEYEKGIEIAQMIDYKPIQEWAYLGIADEAAKGGKVDIALKVADEISSSNKKNNLLRNIANSYAKQGQFESMIAVVDDISNKIAKDITFNMVANVYIEQGQIAQAERVVDLIEDSHERNSVLQRIVVTYREQGQVEKATQLKEKLTVTDPNFDKRLQFVEIAEYVQQGQVDEALELVASNEEEITRNDGYSQIALSLAELGEIERAYQVMESISSVDMLDTTFMEITHQHALQGDLEEAIKVVKEREFRVELFRGEIFKWMGVKLARVEKYDQARQVIAVMQDEIQIEQVKIAITKGLIAQGKYEESKDYIADLLKNPEYAGIGLELCFTMLEQDLIEPVLEVAPLITKVRYQILVNLRVAAKLAATNEMDRFKKIIEDSVQLVRDQNDPRSEILLVDIANHLAMDGHTLEGLKVVTKIQKPVEKSIALAMVYKLPEEAEGKKLLKELLDSLK